jgi:hypothetical protein
VAGQDKGETSKRSDTESGTDVVDVRIDQVANIRHNISKREKDRCKALLLLVIVRNTRGGTLSEPDFLQIHFAHDTGKNARDRAKFDGYKRVVRHDVCQAGGSQEAIGLNGTAKKVALPVSKGVSDAVQYSVAYTEAAPPEDGTADDVREHRKAKQNSRSHDLLGQGIEREDANSIQYTNKHADRQKRAKRERIFI